MARNRYDMDEVLEEKFDINQVKRLAKYVAPHKKKMLLALFLMLSSAFLSTFLPKFLQLEMDVYIPDKNITGIVGIVLLTAVICIYLVVCIRLKITLTMHVGQDVIHQLREDIFEKLQELPFSYYDERPHGKIQVRVVNYVNNLSDILSNGILQTITDLFNLLFIIGFMFYMNVRLTLICLCGLPFLFLFIVLIKRGQRRAWQIQSNKQSNLNAYISESINGIRVTQAFVREDKNTEIFNNLSQNYRDSWMHASYYGFAMGPMVDLISTITTAFVYVLGVHYIIDGNVSGVSIGVLIAFTAYISRFWAPINTIASFYNSVVTAVSYLERIFETIDEPVEVKDAKDAIEMPAIQGKLEFEHVTFSYEKGVEILKDVNFSVEPGKTIAFVGPTGAGKSTIVNLISRFYNVDSGRILIDGNEKPTVGLKARAFAAAGSDARMNGCPMPVVINSGSGNQGITVSVPVIVYAKEKNIEKEKLLRGLVVSNLIAVHQKKYIGSLSAYCGVVSAACGAACGICYMLGYPYEVVCETITNTIATVGGMVCDGAKSSCAAKISTALQTALLGMKMGLHDRAFQPGEGLVEDDVEETIRSIGRMGRDGMHSTDLEILNIMLGN